MRSNLAGIVRCGRDCRRQTFRLTIESRAYRYFSRITVDERISQRHFASDVINRFYRLYHSKIDVA